MEKWSETEVDTKENDPGFLSFKWEGQPDFELSTGFGHCFSFFVFKNTRA